MTPKSQQFGPIKKGEKHHWWPESLQKFWTNNKGRVNAIRADGQRFDPNPSNVAHISDGHNLHFRDDSPWSRSYEGLFHEPDGAFPDLVYWLQQIVQNHPRNVEETEEELYISQACSDAEWRRLILGLVSLNVRSPRHREASTSLASKFNPSISKKEKMNIVTLGLLQGYPGIVDTLARQGKIAVFFSESCELIYGDGFYSNLNTPFVNGTSTRMLVPVTPNIAVLYTSPMHYIPDPRLVTRRADCGLVRMFNELTQIYSKDYLFYRFQEPNASQHFLANEHLQIVGDDPMDEIISRIPGVDFGPPLARLF